MLTFNYNRAIAQVRVLREVADEMRSIANRTLAQSIDSTRASWKGQNAQRFLVKCETLKSQVLREADNITQLANSIE